MILLGDKHETFNSLFEGRATGRPRCASRFRPSPSHHCSTGGRHPRLRPTGGVIGSEAIVRERLPVRFVQGEKQRSLSLYLSSCCYRPDGFELAIAIGVVEVMQVDGRIDMAGDKLYAIAHFKLNAG